MNSQLCLRPPFFSRVLSNYNWHPSPTGIFLDLLYLNVQERARVVKKVTICFFSRDSMGFFFFLILFIYLFILFFLTVLGLRFCARTFSRCGKRGPLFNRGARASHCRGLSCCAGLSLSRPLLLRSTGSRSAGSVVVAHGPSCSAACGIFPDQGSNPCPLHWQADSQPLRHQGSPPWALLRSCVTNLPRSALLRPWHRWLQTIHKHGRSATCSIWHQLPLDSWRGRHLPRRPSGLDLTGSLHNQQTCFWSQL